MGDPDDGEMIGMTNNEVKKYAAVEETNGRINTHIIPQEQVSHITGAGQSYHRSRSVIPQEQVSHITGAGQSYHRSRSVI